MLFDTDVIIWALRGNVKAASSIDKDVNRTLSCVSYMELIKGARNKQELHTIKQYLHDFRFAVLPISENISHRASIYIEEFVLQSGLDIADALIAATSTEQALLLCTANTKHYKVIPDLQLKRFRPE